MDEDKLIVDFERLHAEVATGRIPKGSLLTSVRVSGVDRDFLLSPIPVEVWDPWIEALRLRGKAWASIYVERGLVAGFRTVRYGGKDVSRLALSLDQRLLCSFELASRPANREPRTANRSS